MQHVCEVGRDSERSHCCLFCNFQLPAFIREEAQEREEEEKDEENIARGFSTVALQLQQTASCLV